MLKESSQTDISRSRELDGKTWFVIAVIIFKLLFLELRGQKVPRLDNVFNIYYALPPPPNVQIYSPNLVLIFYIFIIFCFISLALTNENSSFSI